MKSPRPHPASSPGIPRHSRWAALPLLLAALLSASPVSATSYALPDPPAPPATAEILAHNQLADADEAALLLYIAKQRSFLDVWLPDLTRQEASALGRRFISYVEKPDAKLQYQQDSEQLTKERLADPARIIDAALRKLGQSGTSASLQELASITESEGNAWARWKALASIQEILLRELPPAEPPGFRPGELLLVAPLLRDLPPEKAQAWAIALWQDPARRAHTPEQSLFARLWFARHAAALKPAEAAAVFREGLASPDLANRTLAGMLLRECLGGSLPHGSPDGSLLKMLSDGTAKPAREIWDVFPKPLDQPLALRHGSAGARTDLVWLGRSANILHRSDEVFPGVLHVLPNGLFYSRMGERHPWTLALTDPSGNVVSRFPGITSVGPPATHGGLWCQTSPGENATEFAADGSILWQCPPGPDQVRKIAPYSAGRVLFLGYKTLECRNRRGDILWKTDLKELDDPRDIVAIGEGRFLLCCTNSIGELSQKGDYKPLLENLGSALWIRYHPAAEWVIHDGSDLQTYIFDPATAKATGRIDLDDGPEYGESKFAPGLRIPE